MSKKAIAILVIIFLLVLGGVFWLMKTTKFTPIPVSTLFGDEEGALDTLREDLDFLAARDGVLNEIDETLSDASDGSEGLSPTDALDSISLDREAGAADFSSDLDSFSNDETKLQDLNQTFGEVLQ